MRRYTLPPELVLNPAVAFPSCHSFTSKTLRPEHVGAEDVSTRRRLSLTMLTSFTALGSLFFYLFLAQWLSVLPVLFNAILVVLCVGLSAGTLYDLESAREYQGLMSLSCSRHMHFHHPFQSRPCQTTTSKAVIRNLSYLNLYWTP